MLELPADEFDSRFSVKGPQAPVVLLASALQLAFYLLRSRYIACGECKFTCDTPVKHFDEFVS